MILSIILSLKNGQQAVIKQSIEEKIALPQRKTSDGIPKHRQYF